MNNSRTLMVMLALVFSGSPLCWAQDEDSAPPAPPYVAKIPDFFQWTVTVAPNKTDGEVPAPVPGPDGKLPPTPLTITQVVYTRTKDIRHDDIYYSNGNHSEIWHVGTRVIMRSPNGEFAIESAGGVAAALLVPDLSSAGFYGVDWVTIGNFVGRDKLDDGTKVFHYKGQEKVPNPGAALFRTTPGAPNKPKPPAETTVPTEALIDVDSRLPLVIKQPVRTLTYSYQSPPTSMLQLPEDMQKRVATLEARESYIKQMRAL